ncbi:hypothetical protein DFQ13_10872 [Actinokineospora spheciospongiae]|nr:hypothetical protein DFQ13_10872 [Actinokineospora spheciospongiae]
MAPMSEHDDQQDEHDHPHAYTSTYVLDGEPITWVFHDHDGDWRVLGDTEVTSDDEGVITHIEDLLKLDPGLADLMTLPVGHAAERAVVGAAWEISEQSEDDEFDGDRAWTTQPVLDGEPVVWIFHDEDGEFQFFGETEIDLDDARVVELAVLVDRDTTLPDLSTIPIGHAAERETPTSPWTVAPFEPEDEEE